LAAILLVCGGFSAFAQQPTFRTGTRTVALYATVTDAQKRLVPDLAQDDFQIYDNDKLQTIDLFVNEVQPITVVVMLDTSASMTGNLKLLEQAAEQFLMRMLPKDKGLVGSFNDKIEFFPPRSPTIATGSFERCAIWISATRLVSMTPSPPPWTGWTRSTDAVWSSSSLMARIREAVPTITLCSIRRGAKR
jgi:hypothetical protein